MTDSYELDLEKIFAGIEISWTRTNPDNEGWEIKGLENASEEYQLFFKLYFSEYMAQTEDFLLYDLEDYANKNLEPSDLIQNKKRDQNLQSNDLYKFKYLIVYNNQLIKNIWPNYLLFWQSKFLRKEITTVTISPTYPRIFDFFAAVENDLNLTGLEEGNSEKITETEFQRRLKERLICRI